jgi:hypothetical protein
MGNKNFFLIFRLNKKDWFEFDCVPANESSILSLQQVIVSKFVVYTNFCNVLRRQLCE